MERKSSIINLTADEREYQETQTHGQAQYKLKQSIEPYPAIESLIVNILLCSNRAASQH